MSAAGGGPEPKTPIINSILEPRFCISLNVHGAYDKKTYTIVPANFVVIEMGLPSQSVYARFYDYIYAIFVDPINLNFLDYPKFTMQDFTRDRDNIMFDKDIQRGKTIQEAILRGDYASLYDDKYEALDPNEKRIFQEKLEVLDKVLRKVTIYKPGNKILGRSLQVYDADGFDPTCTIDVRDTNLKAVNWEEEPFLNEILKGIKQYGPLANAATTTEIINELSAAGTPMKIIIFTCGHVTKNLDDIILDLANEVDELRISFYQERIDNSGPSPIKNIKTKERYDPYPRNLCISYKGDPTARFLSVPQEEFTNNANANINNVNSTQGYENAENMEDTEKLICSSDNSKYHGTISFLYTFLSPRLPPIIRPDQLKERLAFESAPIDKPFISLTFTELISEYLELYDSMYLVSKGDMVLYKVEDLFNKYITKAEIKKWISKDKNTLDLYTRVAAKYIMQPFQLEGDKNLGKHVMDFKTFRDIAGGPITQLTAANKLLSEIESLYEPHFPDAFIPDDRTIYYKKYLKTLDAYKHLQVVDLMRNPRSGLPATLDLTMNEDTPDMITKFIEQYITSSYKSIEFVVDISAYSKPSDIEEEEGTFFFEYSKSMREYLLTQLRSKGGVPGAAGGGGAGGGAAAGGAAMNERKRKSRKARKYKNRKSLRKKNK